MKLFHGNDADTVWHQAIQDLKSLDVTQDSRDQITHELIHTAFTIDSPRQRVVFGRPINPAFAVAEVIWILSGANDAQFLSFWNPRIWKYVDRGNSFLHGAYGTRLGFKPKLSDKVRGLLRHPTEHSSIDQLKRAYETLRLTPHSRQVVLQFWDNVIDMPDPQPQSLDIPCNIVSHLMVRNNRLEWLQVMRSNDVIWGTPYNFIQFTTMQEIVAGWLGVEVGSYSHISDSLHVYQRHWKDVEAIGPSKAQLPINHADLRIGPYEKWEVFWSEFIERVVLIPSIEDKHQLISLLENSHDIPTGYREWLYLLVAEALRRRKYFEEAEQIIKGAGLFWATSWHQWYEHTRLKSAVPKFSSN